MYVRSGHFCENCGISDTTKAYYKLRYKLPKQWNQSETKTTTRTRFTVYEAVNSVLALLTGTRTSIPLSQQDRELCSTCLFKLKTWFKSSCAFLSKTANGTYFDHLIGDVDRDPSEEDTTTAAGGSLISSLPSANSGTANDISSPSVQPRYPGSTPSPSKKKIPCCASCKSVPSRLLIDFRTVVHDEILLVTNSDAFDIVFGPDSSRHQEKQSQAESQEEQVLLCETCSKPLSELYTSYLHFMAFAKEASYLHERIGEHFYRVQVQEQIKDEAAEDEPSPPYISGIDMQMDDHQQWKEETTGAVSTGSQILDLEPLIEDQGFIDHIHFMDTPIVVECTDKDSGESLGEREHIEQNPDNEHAVFSKDPKASVGLGSESDMGTQIGGESNTATAVLSAFVPPTSIEVEVGTEDQIGVAIKPPKNRRKQKHLSQFIDNEPSPKPKPSKKLARKFTSAKTTTTSRSNSSKMPNIVSVGLFDEAQETPILTITASSSNTDSRPSYKCGKCNALFRSKQSLIKHRRTHFQPPEFPCTLCTKTFYTSNKLNRHLVIRHQVGDKLPEKTCPTCGKYFGSAIILQRHRTSVHSEKLFQCPLCPEKFVSFIEMVKHKKQERLTITGYPCSECGKKFRTPAYLRSHKARIHPSSVPSNPCPKCGKSYKTERSLGKHYMRCISHVPKERIKDKICEICGGAFYSIKQLNMHRNIHNGAKKHVCQVCGKGFYKPHGLKGHMARHGEAKPFECQDCGKTFKRDIYLNRHRLRIHASDEERGGPWECDLCGQIFKSKELRSKHKRSKFHGGKGTYYKMYKQTRKVKPTENSTGSVVGEPRTIFVNGKACFKCDNCLWVFASELQLKYHKMQQHGKSKCDQCGMNVASIEELVQHQQEAHLPWPAASTTTTDKSTESKSAISEGNRRITRRSPGKYRR